MIQTVKTLLAHGLLSLSVLLLTPDASSAAQVKKVLVKGGEHSKFSRIVIEADGIPYKVEYARRKLKVTFPGAAHSYELGLINDKRKAHRVIAGRPIKGDGGSGLEFDLTCKCGTRIDYSKSGSLIIDISEAYGAPPAKVVSGVLQPEDKKPLSSTAVAELSALKNIDGADLGEDAARLAADDSIENARSKMLALLSQAADEGLVSFKDETEAEDEKNSGEPSGQKVPKKLIRYKCASNGLFFPGVTGKPLDDPLSTINQLNSQIVGEFDAANEAVVRALYWTYLSIGFGDEALAILGAFPLQPAEQEFLKDLATVVSDRTLIEDSPLRRSYGCNGIHAIWRAVGLARENPSLAVREADPWVEDLAKLPIELRGDFATRLGLAALAAKEFKIAGKYQKEAEFINQDSAGFKFLTAEVERSRGRDDKARALLTDLAEGQSQHQRDALFALADEYKKKGEPLPDGYADDLGMAAAVAETSAMKERTIVMEAGVLINAGEFNAAFQEIIRTYRTAPEARAGLGLAARTLLVQAMMQGDGAAQLAALDAYLDNQAFWGVTENGTNNDKLHTTAATIAIKYGLPELARFALKQRLGAVDIATQTVMNQIDRLSSMMNAASVDGAERQPELSTTLANLRAQNEETISPEDARVRVETAYLAGKTATSAEINAFGKQDGLDVNVLFKKSADAGNSNAASVKKFTDDMSADILLMKEIVNGK
ncbi:MAG: hypothetical protein AAF720_04470 [Pseudomonadota bacterium]